MWERACPRIAAPQFWISTHKKPGHQGPGQEDGGYINLVWQA
ncbi:hypothetical protein SAMN04490194_1938 [Pseudomonas migulae]|uniref:Uncharacterized protein n=1 Tax=Pseudomonas migulae TaxID=78543 RepID=A0A1H5I841_9PSED|nr:hypothetical protein SAMN04490194_1938 [Pseudomonas migulae]